MNKSTAGLPPAPVVKYDLAVFIGRFQPFHEGHASVIRMALDHADQVLCLVGSSFAPRSYRNPFTFAERAQMIRSSVDTTKVVCEPLEDSPYNDNRWIMDVQAMVTRRLDAIEQAKGAPIARRVTLVGHSKDHTSFYLNMFPGYDSLAADNYQQVSSTPMRAAYFSNICEMWLNDCDGHKPGDRSSDHLVSPSVREFLINFRQSNSYRAIREEYDFIQNYRAKRATAPFPVTMVTCDAMVIQSGHILLVRRKGMPGRGQWVLPGGYLSRNEKIVDGMIRELVEETRLAVDKDLLRKSIVANGVFDDVHRDPRGRVITHAFRIDLPPRRTPTKITNKRIKIAAIENEPVTGADDAEFAKWFPLAEVKREMMAFDHIDIIRSLGGFN